MSKETTTKSDNKPEETSSPVKWHKTRRPILSGPIASRVPPARPGFFQYVALDKDDIIYNLTEDGGYDYRVWDSGPNKGKKISFKGKNNELFYVLEIPQEIRDEILAEKKALNDARTAKLKPSKHQRHREDVFVESLSSKSGFMEY